MATIAGRCHGEGTGAPVLLRNKPGRVKSEEQPPPLGTVLPGVLQGTDTGALLAGYFSDSVNVTGRIIPYIICLSTRLGEGEV